MRNPLQNPIGEVVLGRNFSPAMKQELIDSLGVFPQKLRQLVANLDTPKLDLLYRNWTIRQIIHHLADSHLHSYIRFKWALTEPEPLIKAYEEGDWVNLADGKNGPLEPSLLILQGIHERWTYLLNSLNEPQFEKIFRHPQTGKAVSLWESLQYYEWHGRHHLQQIVLVLQETDDVLGDH